MLCAATRVLAAVLTGARVASLYRSRPISAIPQDDFLNTAVVGRTRLAPRALLELAQRLETLAGRRAGPRDGPRPLDVDLLLYGDLRLAEADLTVPHPRLAARRFALAPLCEIAPAMRVPPDGLSVGELLAAVGQEGDVTRLGPVC